MNKVRGGRRMSLAISGDLHNKLDAVSAQTGIPISRLVDICIMAHLHKIQDLGPADALLMSYGFTYVPPHERQRGSDIEKNWRQKSTPERAAGASVPMQQSTQHIPHHLLPDDERMRIECEAAGLPYPPPVSLKPDTPKMDEEEEILF